MITARELSCLGLINFMVQQQACITTGDSLFWSKFYPNITQLYIHIYFQNKFVSSILCIPLLFPNGRKGVSKIMDITHLT